MLEDWGRYNLYQFLETISGVASRSAGDQLTFDPLRPRKELPLKYRRLLAIDFEMEVLCLVAALPSRPNAWLQLVVG